MSARPFELRDAHVHIAEYGESLSLPGFSGCTCIEGVLGVVRRASSALGEGEWVTGTGLRVEGLRERRYPTASELDDAAGGRPVLIRSFDHHAVVVSTAALKLAGIDEGTPDPLGGVIVREGGVTTGVLLESACEAAWRAVPAPSADRYAGFVRAALDDFMSRGIVEVHDMLSRPELAAALLELERTGGPDVRVELYAPVEHFDAVRDRLARAGSSMVKCGGLKLFADGTLNSRTASMLYPYANPQAGRPRGEALLTTDQVASGIERARSAGVRLAVHAIGDAAVRRVLDAEAGVNTRLDPGGVPSALTTRIEHAQFVDPLDVERFAVLRVIASPQPCHLLTDIEAIRRHVPDRERRAFPLRDIVSAYTEAGLDPARWVWLGTDAPVVRPEPADNVQGAAERRRAGMPASEAVAPEQAISADLAWTLMRPAAL